MIMRFQLFLFLFAWSLVSCVSDKGVDFSLGSKPKKSSRIAMSSLRNDNLLPKFINTARAKKHALSYRGGDSVKVLEKRIAALRVAKAGFSEVQQATLKLVNLELEKSLGRSMSERAKIEVGLSALQNKRFGMAMIIFDELHRSRDNLVRAAAWTASGVLALTDRRHPEAVNFWEQALRAVPGFGPAALNLAFMNLRFGRFPEAQRHLQQAPQSWLKDAGMMILARVQGNTSMANKLCDKLLSVEPNHKMILFNCVVHQWVNNKDKEEARSLVQKALRAKGGEPGWNVRGRQFLGRIR